MAVIKKIFNSIRGQVIARLKGVEKTFSMIAYATSKDAMVRVVQKF